MAKATWHSIYDVLSVLTVCYELETSTLIMLHDIISSLLICDKKQWQSTIIYPILY